MGPVPLCIYTTLQHTFSVTFFSGHLCHLPLKYGKGKITLSAPLLLIDNIDSIGLSFKALISSLSYNPLTFNTVHHYLIPLPLPCIFRAYFVSLHLYWSVFVERHSLESPNMSVLNSTLNGNLHRYFLKPGTVVIRGSSDYLRSMPMGRGVFSK